MRLTSVVCILSVGAALTAGGASATPPEPVSIVVQTVDAGSDGATGPFTAFGPICPSGMTYTVSRELAGFERGFGGQIRVTKLFVCDDGSGSFELKLNVAIGFAPFSDTYEWVVVGGKGAYENLHGTGSGTGTPTDAFLLDEYSGSVHTD
jgi:hypothetical protein